MLLLLFRGNSSANPTGIDRRYPTGAATNTQAVTGQASYTRSVTGGAANTKTVTGRMPN